MGLGYRCYYCTWGWPVKVAEIYMDAYQKLEAIDYFDPAMALDYGPGHIVWADDNFDQVQWCLDNFDKYLGEIEGNEAAQAIVRESLERLAAMPEDETECCPDNYDGENPENYPPIRPTVKILYTIR